ncbi:MAG: nucleotidyltransferase domain-containing protein [Chloroflexi bacterium]|nr:nucleotidyltransferase domain-containing protein [Chloroflexota bacterium]
MQSPTLKINTKSPIILRDRLVQHLAQFALIQKIYTFGSFARADWDAWSDIDLLLIASRNPTMSELLDNLSSFQILMHRSNFAAQVQPAGGFLLGVLFDGESIFHNLDLNFMTMTQHSTFQNLERFGKLELLYENTEKAIPSTFDVERQYDDYSLVQHEQQLEYAIHWTKKAVKRVLRGDTETEELHQTSANLGQLLSTPNEQWSARGDVCKVAQTFFNIAKELLENFDSAEHYTI